MIKSAVAIGPANVQFFNLLLAATGANLMSCPVVHITNYTLAFNQRVAVYVATAVNVVFYKQICNT